MYYFDVLSAAKLTVERHVLPDKVNSLLFYPSARILRPYPIPAARDVVHHGGTGAFAKVLAVVDSDKVDRVFNRSRLAKRLQVSRRLEPLARLQHVHVVISRQLRDKVGLRISAQIKSEAVNRKDTGSRGQLRKRVSAPFRNHKMNLVIRPLALRSTQSVNGESTDPSGRVFLPTVP
jgi:hypothetical protein